MRKVVTLVIAIAALLPLALAAPASASITIGPNPLPDPNNSACPNGSPCTIANLVVPGAQLSAPIDGVVTSWAVRWIGNTVPVRLRVLRPLGQGAFEGISSSVQRMLPSVGPPTTTIFTTQQPIRQGDLVGLNIDSNSPNLTAFELPTQPGVSSGFWQPALADGDNRSPAPGAPAGSEYTFNATIETDCDGDGLGDETQDTDLSACKPKDTTPPNTSIGKGPKKKIHAKGPKTKVKFTFSSTETGSSFKCKLDKKAFAACTSPKTYKVKPGKHSFQVEAIDAIGNVDGTPAKKSFKVLPAVQ